MQEMDLTVEEVDALTGQAVGWPRSATFRTIDLVGLDILGHVVGNMTQNVHDERSELQIPAFFRQMLERKWLGDKTKGGFYKKGAGRGPSPADPGKKEDERLALDWKTLEYHPRQKPKFAALDMAKNVEETPARIRMLLGLDGGAQKADKAGAFLWAALSDLWTYSANRIPEISDSIVEIDRAMRLGFNWELGPFELWDAAGVEGTVGRMRAEGRVIPCNVERLLHSERRSWYENAPGTRSGRRFFDVASGECEYKDEEVPAGISSATVMKKCNGEVKRNAGASLIDLGEGVGCIEFHSKMNSIGPDIGQLILQTLGFTTGFEACLWERRRRSPAVAGKRLRGLRNHQRCGEFFRGCQPHAAADGRAGAGVGRNRPDGARLPEHDPGDQVLAQASGGGAVQPHPRRRVRNRPACTGSPGSRRTLHGTGGKWGWAIACRGWLQSGSKRFIPENLTTLCGTSLSCPPSSTQSL